MAIVVAVVVVDWSPWPRRYISIPRWFVITIVPCVPHVDVWYVAIQFPVVRNVVSFGYDEL